jgi:hypothetical protein
MGSLVMEDFIGGCENEFTGEFFYAQTFSNSHFRPCFLQGFFV